MIASFAVAQLLSPATAFAHGRGVAVAVSDRARITQLPGDPPAFQVRVIDGDQGLWLRRDTQSELIVLGISGEPVLRFDRSGVYVNRHSPTAQIDQIAARSIVPSFAPHARPSWKKLTSGRSYRWHEHRIHALAPLGGTGPARDLGRWTIPLRIAGKPVRLVGELRYVPPPNLLLWLAIPIAILAAAAAVIVSRRERLIRRTTMLVTATTAVAVVIARGGREFYGRPTPVLGGYLSFAIGVAVALFVLERTLLRPTAGLWFLALVVGAVGLAEGAGLAPTLYRGVVLAATPPSLERSCVAVTLGAAAASAVLAIAISVVDSAADDELLDGLGSNALS